MILGQAQTNLKQVDSIYHVPITTACCGTRFAQRGQNAERQSDDTKQVGMPHLYNGNLYTKTISAEWAFRSRKWLREAENGAMSNSRCQLLPPRKRHSKFKKNDINRSISSISDSELSEPPSRSKALHLTKNLRSRSLKAPKTSKLPACVHEVAHTLHRSLGSLQRS